MEYRMWQIYREKMKQREIKEREGDVTAPRPPINASINDQAIRDLLDRVGALEASATLKTFAATSPVVTHVEQIQPIKVR